MIFERSKGADKEALRKLVEALRRRIDYVTMAGRRVTVVWDFDWVLVAGRTADAFALLGNDDASKYLYEERLLSEEYDDGPMLALAEECGDLHEWQEIIVTRPRFLAIRAAEFLRSRPRLADYPITFIDGDEDEATETIVRRAARSNDGYLFRVSASMPSLRSFARAAQARGFGRFGEAVHVPTVRDYDETELAHETDEVLRPAIAPFQVVTYDPQTGLPKRQVTARPGLTLTQARKLARLGDRQLQTLAARLDALRHHVATIERRSPPSTPSEPPEYDGYVLKT